MLLGCGVGEVCLLPFITKSMFPLYLHKVASIAYVILKKLNYFVVVYKQRSYIDYMCKSMAVLRGS